MEDALNKELRKQAIELGLCNEWRNLWKEDWSQDKMVERMFAGLDFCLQHHWPSNEFILKHFERKFLRSHNVFVDDKYSIVNQEEVIALGNSDVRLRYNGNGYGNIHVRDNSHVVLTAKNRSFVIVHTYENARIEATQFDNAQITIILHSHNVDIRKSGDVAIREEYDYLK